MKYKFITLRDVGSDGDTASATITTADVDRDGDTIRADGWQLGNYLKNPVVLFGHRARDLPVARAETVERVHNGLRASWRWLVGDDFAERVRNAWQQRALSAVSVGFRPLKWEPSKDRPGGIDFLEQELLEFSIVPVPANPAAVRALKAAGLDPLDAFASGLPDTLTVPDLLGEQIQRDLKRREEKPDTVTLSPRDQREILDDLEASETPLQAWLRIHDDPTLTQRARDAEWRRWRARRWQRDQAARLLPGFTEWRPHRR